MEEVAKVGMSRQDNGGFTLVELMVAMLITLVGLVGLLQSVNLAMEHNLKNQLRDEAVLVGEKMMAFQKVRPFGHLSTSHPPLVDSRLRSGVVKYTVTCTTTDLSTAKQIIVGVTWAYRGTGYSHQVRSIRSE